MDGWKGWVVDGWVDGWSRCGWIGGWVNGRMEGMMGGWMGGWVIGWTGWMGGWVICARVGGQVGGRVETGSRSQVSYLKAVLLSSLTHPSGASHLNAVFDVCLHGEVTLFNASEACQF